MQGQTEQVGDIVEPDGQVRTINASRSIVEASQEMQTRGISSLIVLSDDERIVGIVTERDIVRKVVADRCDPQQTTVSAIMTINVLVCSLQTRLAKAAQVMSDHNIRHLPVVRDSVPVAMISARDILAHELKASRSMVQGQSKLIEELEAMHPGICDLERTASGRIAI